MNLAIDRTNDDSDTCFIWSGDMVRRPARPFSEFEPLIERIDHARKQIAAGRIYLAQREAAELRSISFTTRGLPRWIRSQIANLSSDIARCF
jgi:hypothetical protein